MSWTDLAHLGEVFDRLRSGRHVSRDDTPIFRDLTEHEDEYRELFTALGFELVHHVRDFFYFRSDARYSHSGARMAVFFFILVEWLSDRGDAIEETLFSRPFDVSELPHLDQKRYRTYMEEAGAGDEESLGNLLKQMERYGFISREGERIIRFKAPAYRLLDLCAEVLKTDTSESQL